MTQVVIVEGNSTRQTTYTFAISKRPIPLQRFWFSISLSLGAIGAFINSKDIWQLLVSLFAFLQKKDTTN